MLKTLEAMKESLISVVMAQMNDLKNTDAKELGEAVDMIKDISEAIYYCTITEAMEEKPRYEDRRMYYDGGGNNVGRTITSSNSPSADRSGDGGRSYYQEREYPIIEQRDPKEGRSYMSRRMYMESKEMGKDKLSSMKDLEHYMRELSEDITEMIETASTEEKQLLQKKLNMLAQKIIG